MEAQLLKHWSNDSDPLLHAKRQEKNSKPSSRGLFDLFYSYLNLFTWTVAMDGIARATLWTNQMGYNITLIAQLPGIYIWQRKPPLSSPRTWLVYGHKSQATGL